MDNNEHATEDSERIKAQDEDDTGDLPANQNYLQGQFEKLEKRSNKTTIFDLPQQVWLDIYENIDYSTFLNMRQTSKHFRDLIDHYIGLRATFNELNTTDPEIFNFFTKVAINDVQFDDARNKDKFNFQTLLAYPSLLTDVSFTGETNLKLIKDIVTNCSCLQLVEMTMDCKIVRDDSETIPEVESRDNHKTKNILPGIDIHSPFPPSVTYLNFVECLKLVPGIHSDDNLRSHLILSILRGTKAEHYLRKVIFQCELSDQISLRDVLMITTEVMEKHPRLEALFLALLNDEYLLNEGEVANFAHYMDLSKTDEGEEINYFKKRIVSSGHHLRIKKMGLAMLNLSMQKIWGDFLKTQHHLVHLSLTVTIESGTFSQEMFDAFSGTLEQLAIRGKFEEPFNFLHVANCRHLKEICLHNLQDNGGGGIIPKCVNLPHAPEDLESLILFQVVTRTEEIREAIDKLEKLSTLVVFKCGHAAGETGIGLRCLQQILHKRSLQSVLMVQFICGSTEEAESLAGVLYDMAQDIENQASPTARRRRQNNRQMQQQQQVVPPNGNEPVNILDLREIEDGGDELLFALGADGGGGPPHRAHLGRDIENPQRRSPSPPLERPVSRGDHRTSDTERSEENSNASPSLSHDQGSPELEPNSESDTTVEIIRLDSSTEVQIGSKVIFEEPVDCIFEPDVDFPPLPDPEPAVSQDEENNNNAALNNEENSGHDDDDDDDDNDSIPDERVENEVDDAINVLQNILEQAMVGNQGELHRNPNLQNHMNLNRLQQDFDENVELILDVGDQDLGPVLDLFAAERLAREHNVQVGFILDGVIDIMNEDVVRSKWLCVEDSDGHITYTLKISVEL